jgi:hypothetical protein
VFFHRCGSRGYDSDFNCCSGDSVRRTGSIAESHHFRTSSSDRDQKQYGGCSTKRLECTFERPASTKRRRYRTSPPDPCFDYSQDETVSGKSDHLRGARHLTVPPEVQEWACWGHPFQSLNLLVEPSSPRTIRSRGIFYSKIRTCLPFPTRLLELRLAR